MTLFKEIDYIPESGQQFELFSKEKSNFSLLSLDLIDKIINKRVTIIFSQGPLNITPFISCIFAELKNNNVIIGLPKHTFSEKYKEYTSEYFSLLYKKFINSTVTAPFFFYQDIIWCQGKIDDDKNELFDLIIEKYPIHGDRTFKRTYEQAISEKLTTGHFKNSPKIILIPIENSIPSNIIGTKTIQFKDENYNLKNFNPNLIILESINERNFKFEHLIQLIKKTDELNIKLVLHFSWPYLRGLDNFLSDPSIAGHREIEIFHFGKRFCIESKKKFTKPPSYALPLSLEGNFWSTIYYPEKSSQSKISILSVPIQQTNPFLSIKDIENAYSAIDDKLANIRENVNDEDISDNFTKNILKFPPITDSFLIPSEIKVRSYIEKINSIRYLSVQDFMEFRLRKESLSFQSFQSLCSDIESCKDLSREIRGLRTYSALSKKTLLQMYIIEEIQKIVKTTNLISLENSKTDLNLIIPKLHPFFETRKNNFDALQYFFQGFSFLLEQINLPKIITKSNKFVIKGKNGDITAFEGNNFKNPKTSDIYKILEHDRPYPVKTSVTKENDSIEIHVKLKVEIPFIKIESIDDMSCKRESCAGLDLYILQIKPNGQFIEISLSEFNNENTFYSNTLNYSAKYSIRTNTLSKTHQIKINVDFIDLPTITNRSQETIKKSILLMPGPVPFQTISFDEVFISQGYDALLLPFEKIVFFSYPGKNINRIVRQLQLYKELFSENPTRISNMDLLYSIEHMKESNRFKFPEKPSIIEPISQIMAPGDTIFDAVIRRGLLDDSNATAEEKEEIFSLKEIWNKIGKTKQDNHHESQKPDLGEFPINREHIILKIRFGDGKEDNISFPRGTLIRKNSGENYLLTQVDELSEDDEILYIEATKRESIDNYLLKDFAQEKGISLEQIFEPFYCLRLFYESLSAIDFRADFRQEIMKHIYWLTDEQKASLFETLKHLADKGDPSLLNTKIQDNPNIWKDKISGDVLSQIFSEGRSRITYEKLFKISQNLGISLAKDTFKQYCTFAINEHQHYYFKNERDLYSIGCLMGHPGIINNYQIINNQGRNVGTILQIIGRCISRVTVGKSDPFNEMDSSIEGKVQKCKILSIKYPELSS